MENHGAAGVNGLYLVKQPPNMAIGQRGIIFVLYAINCQRGMAAITSDHSQHLGGFISSAKIFRDTAAATGISGWYGPARIGIPHVAIGVESGARLLVAQ